MTAKESVKNRLEGDSGISYTEFSYMLLQAFDFVHLSRSYGCRLQVGGSDQYGNITAGVELSHKLRGPQLFGLVAPLLLDSTGAKMGKTASGERVWLDPERTRPYEFYQYWFNVSDEQAPSFLRMFSLRPLDEIEQLLREHDADRTKHLAQAELARALTSWVHGDSAVVGIQAANRIMFGDVSLKDLTNVELEALANILPRLDVPRADLAAGIPLVDILSRTVTDSKGSARRLITQGGAYVNGVQIKSADHTLALADLVTETMLVLRSGKRNYHLVRVT
jgi:tyrosyl-tRNA synthetase